MELLLSVVTGTYNRLTHMQRMCQSVRASVGRGIPYEIVLVDGGSTDGTIEWAKAQPDIKIIEQGELLGAIKAFNAGLFAAEGRYCVVGNDDIEYMDETLPKAIAFMEDHPDVGVGCFYQDRDHPDRYDLSYMPAIVKGEQMNHVYGQVCIVPKWLGDQVGWWGSYPDQRTYGGDNNLSCFALEAGYRVTGIQCACIHDLKVEDELREINNQIKTKNGQPYHPDSVAWGKRWTHTDGTCGPIVRDAPIYPNPIERKTRFMYLPIYEVGHEIQHRTKHGLRDALANYGAVYEYDWLHVAQAHNGQYMIDYMMDIMDSWQPDVLLTQIHSSDPRMFNASSVKNIRSQFPGLTWVNWNGDYHPEDLLSRSNVAMCRLFDVQCVVTTAVRDIYSRTGVNWMYWQIGFEDGGGEPDNSTPRHDILFLGNGYSSDRYNLGRMLRGLPYDTGIYGSWGGGFQVNGANLYDFTSGERLYKAARLSVGDNQWGDRAVGFVSNRLFQAMAAGGAMLLHQHVPDLDKLLGLRDGVHYREWTDLNHLRQLIDYYMEHDRERQQIAMTGTAFVRNYHSFDNRVKELMEVIG